MRRYGMTIPWLGMLLGIMLTTGRAEAQEGLPASDKTAAETLAASPRHSEYVMLEDAGTGRKLQTFVVYPERSDPAPAVIVIHEIYGLTEWVKAVADRLAADGFIAIAPDFISGKGPEGGNSDALASPTAAVPLVSGLRGEEIEGTIRAAVAYAQGLPAANGRVGSVGYCWGGRTVFNFAVQTPGIGAGVVYYGTSPSEDRIGAIQAPVLGLYGENDARVNVTIEPGRALMEAAGKSFESHIYDGAGHGFLRQQDGMEGANLSASQDAWPRTLAFLRTHLGSGVNGDDAAQP